MSKSYDTGTRVSVHSIIPYLKPSNSTKAPSTSPGTAATDNPHNRSSKWDEKTVDFGGDQVSNYQEYMPEGPPSLGSLAATFAPSIGLLVSGALSLANCPVLAVASAAAGLVGAAAQFKATKNQIGDARDKEMVEWSKLIENQSKMYDEQLKADDESFHQETFDNAVLGKKFGPAYEEKLKAEKEKVMKVGPLELIGEYLARPFGGRA